MQTVAPIEPPITVEDLKGHARYTDDSNNTQLEAYILAATQAAEDYLGRGLLTQTWKLLLDDFAEIIPLPMAAPLQSVASIKYYDTNGVQQTLATTYYDTDTVSRPGRVVLKPDQSWPSLQSERRNGRVEIVYVVGWTEATLVPEPIKQGIRMLATALDSDRDGLEVRAADARRAAERCWTDRVMWSPPTY